MAKAYILSCVNDSDQGVVLVWSTSSQQAKHDWHNDLDCDYIDRRCKRAEEFDNMEDAPEKEIMYIQWQLGWTWDYLNPPECNYNTPKEVFNKWYDDEYCQL